MPDFKFTPYEPQGQAPQQTAPPVPQTGGFQFTPYDPNPTKFQMNAPVLEPKKGYGGIILSSLGTALDFLSRGQYASAKFFDSLGDESVSVLGSLNMAFNELIDPKDRLSFSDVIKRNNAAWANDNPGATAVLGFLGDIALDPTTYLGVGLSKTGLQIGGKTLARVGVEAVKAGEAAIDVKRFLGATKADLVEVLNAEARQAARTGQTAFSPAGTSILKDAGYFDDLSRRALEITQQFDSKVTMGEAEEIAKREIYRDLKDQKYKGLVTDLSAGEVREVAEQRIMRVAAIRDDLKLFEPGGIRLKVGLPFGSQMDIPGSRQALQLLGVNRLAENISTLASKIPGVNTVKRVFNKESGFDKLPTEFVDNFHSIENTFDGAVAQTYRDVQSMVKDIPHERRTVIQEAMSSIDDKTRILEQQLGRTVTQSEADAIKIQGLQAARLTTKEHAFVAATYQSYAQMSELEMRTNLLRSSLANYTHREYTALADPNVVTATMKQSSNNLNTFLGSSQTREYLTLAEARAAGNVPEMDAAVVLAQRMIKHRTKMATAHFNESVREAFGLPAAEYGAQITTKEFNRLPKVVQSSLKSLGDSVYPVGMNDEMKNVLKAMDAGTTWFRRAATVAKPSFATKQYFSNTIQSAMVAGVTAFKAFDPRAAMDAGLLLFDRGKATKELPEFINTILGSKFGSDAVLAQRLAMEHITGTERAVDYASKMEITSVLGTKYPGTEVRDMLQRNGLVNGFDVNGETFGKKIQNALNYNPDSVGGVAKELSKFWNWPKHTEDYGKAMLFINGLRMGYSEKEAVRMTHKALFNYSRGLSQVEKDVFRRVLPFYTYQRFAIPLVLNNAITQPGNAATAQKVVKLFEKMFTGDSLTPAERDTFGDTYLVEQPRLFNGFDKSGKAGFNILNNFTPFDTLSLLEYGKDGSVDYRRTAEKSILAAMTPFLKVPLEEIVGKQFFTGAVMSKAGRMGALDKEGQIDAVLPGFIKDAIGWERRVNLRTGDTSVYINPYLAHASTSFIPAIKNYVNLGDGSKTGWERAMDFIVGVGTAKIDLKQQNQFAQLKGKKEIADLKSSIRSARIRGSKNEYEQSMSDYRDLLTQIGEQHKLQGPIRGQGISNPEQPPTNPEGVQQFK